MIRLRLAPLLSFLVVATAYAEEAPPRRPNLVVIRVEGLSDVGAPAWGLDEVLPDPEIRARVTPDLARLAAMGARFENAFTDGSDGLSRLEATALRLHQSGGYAYSRDPNPTVELPSHRVDQQRWSIDGSTAEVRWRELIPTDRREDDLSVEAWERLVESQAQQRAAAWVAEQISGAAPDGPPRLLVTTLRRQHKPWQAAGVFFDRFPLDQIALPQSEAGLRRLAGRMGLTEIDPERLAADPGTALAWRRAIRAWLASASAADYAAGKIVDAVAAVNEDENPANHWAVVLVATPPVAEPAEAIVQELPSRADLVLAAPETTKPGQRVITPIDLSHVAKTISALAGVAPLGPTLEEVKEADPGAPHPLVRTSLLPLLLPPGEPYHPLALAPTGERYDRVAITVADNWFGVRSRRFRLVHGPEGQQQLYDVSKDPSGLLDLLDEENDASIVNFGLSSTQVEAVRKWLAGLLTHHLIIDQQAGPEHGDAIRTLKAAGISPKAPGPNHQIPGDFNRDGAVDAADKTVWRDTLGEEVERPGKGADANHDARVDDEDGDIWRANYGRRAGQPPALPGDRPTDR